MTSRINVETLEKIENLQQDLITHIRTSGIRKPRETSLIDEVMEIRRETRKICSVLLNNYNASNDAVEKLRNELTENSTRRSESQLEEVKSLKTRIDDLQREKDSLELRLREDLKTELEKNNFVHKLRFDKLRQKYEQAMRSVESKLNDVTGHKEVSDQASIEAAAQQMLLVEKSKLEEQYLVKFQSYKKALVSVSNREKDLEQSLVKYQELNQAFEIQNSKLKKNVFMLEESLEESKAREFELMEGNRVLTERVDGLTMELNRLKAELTSSFDEQKKTIKEENDRKLAVIDEKIRKMLESKDAEIHKLSQENKYSVMKLKEAERLLDTINSEFRQVKSSSGASSGRGSGIPLDRHKS